mmetsp:Transcript_12422/g.25398  ORF Transcript_12422/g.25398 Transcript_12422/m.25398 type:complete len:200 (+) Transcript_12422:111-710(+)
MALIQLTRRLTNNTNLIRTTLAKKGTFSTLIDRVKPSTIVTTLNLDLPPPPTPKANYGLTSRVGSTLYISGHLPMDNQGNLMVGRIGEGDVGEEEGYEAARLCGMNILSTLENEYGLDAIERCVKLFGIINSSPTFTSQHICMNGCSDLMIKTFGPKNGYHARSAIGTGALPMGMMVEVEGIFKIKEEYLTELSSLREV